MNRGDTAAHPPQPNQNRCQPSRDLVLHHDQRGWLGYLHENTSLGGVKLYKFTLLVKAALINLLEINVSTLLIETCQDCQDGYSILETLGGT